MAGHSKFKNIMHRKGAQDAKRSRLFTRHFRAITVAAKSDPDPETNFNLRSVIIAAKADNVPKDKITRAIQGASASPDCEEVHYEGFAAGGVGIIAVMLTDNRRRTASLVRRIFDQFGGHLAEKGEVQFLFQRFGMVNYPQAVAAQDAMLLCAAEHEAEDYWFINGRHVMIFPPEIFHKQLPSLEKMFGTPAATGLIWHPVSLAPAGNEETVFKLMSKLAEEDDYQQFFTNHPNYAKLQERLAAE